VKGARRRAEKYLKTRLRGGPAHVWKNLCRINLLNFEAQSFGILEERFFKGLWIKSII